MTSLLLERDLARKQVGRQQPLEEVVVAAVAVAPRKAEHARDRIRLEDGAHRVRRDPEPVGRLPLRPLEVERRPRPLDADPLEHLPRDLGVLRNDARPVCLQVPRNHGNELPGQGEPLVQRLEDLAALVEEVAPAGS